MRQLGSVSPFGREQSAIDKMIDKALDHVEISKGWPKKWISPSMFPICSVREYIKQQYQKKWGGVTQETGVMLEIFAGAGTGMHNAMQKGMAASGQFYGHWKCQNDKECSLGKAAKSSYKDGKYKKGKYTRLRSTDNICPECKKPMKYEEIKILYKRLKGFVDGIIDNLDGTYSLIDFKSTMIKKAEDGSFFVKYHQLQISAYAYVLTTRYKMKIKDYTLIYMPRDNPKRFVSRTFKYDADAAKIAKNLVNEQLKAWEAVMESAKANDPAKAIKHKPCKSQDYYWNEFHAHEECPFVDFCFIDNRLKARLKEIEERINCNPQLTYAEVVRPQRKKEQQGLKKKTYKKERPRIKQISI